MPLLAAACGRVSYEEILHNNKSPSPSVTKHIVVLLHTSLQLEGKCTSTRMQCAVRVTACALESIAWEAVSAPEEGVVSAVSWRFRQSLEVRQVVDPDKECANHRPA